MDTIKTMNGTVWVFAAILIAMVIIQALLYLKLAMSFNRKHGVLTSAEVKQAAKTGAIAAIGPGFSNMTVAVALCAMMGSGVAFMRCGVIGAPSWELMMADASAKAVGVEFNTPEFTPAIFTLCLFGMALMSAGYFIACLAALKPLDVVVTKNVDTQETKKRSFAPYMSDAAMMGLTVYMLIDYVKTKPSIIAAVVSALVMYGIMQFARKIKNGTLESFGMAIAMISAMIAGQIVTGMMG